MEDPHAAVQMGLMYVNPEGPDGKPDPVAFEIVKAFVALRDGYKPTEELRREIMAFARTRLGAAVAPKQILDDAAVKSLSGFSAEMVDNLVLP